MNSRKLLPAAIGAILAGSVGVAQADVQVFGHLDLSINYIDGGDVSGSQPSQTGVSNGRSVNSTAKDNNGAYVAFNDEDTRFECTTCSIGFKGSEDLGNGLKAIFKLDFQFDMQERNSNGSITDRDQWLGMAGNFGQVRVGTISQTYKSTGAMLDPGYRTIAQQRDIGVQSVLHRGAGSNGQGRAENTARYDSPSWNGLKFAAHYTLVPDNNNDVNGQVADDNGYGASVQYENGGILVFGNYITNGADGDADAYKVGGKYTLNNFSVFGQYEIDGGMITDGYNGTLGADTDGDGADVWMVGGSYGFGNNLIYASYAQGSGTDASAAELDVAAKDAREANPFLVDDYTSWNVVGIHKLSKRSLVYAGYVGIRFDAKFQEDIDHFTAGMKHKF
jgi:predicted porin